ncbi:MAG: aromatic ring-hydroxylating dioxygenase subunit alpha [Actinomycetota bacterium]
MTAEPDQPTEPGQARSPGLSYQDLLDADTHPVPAVLREESPRYLGDGDYAVARYTSRDWHEREKTQLWDRVWQFVCREDHIPEAGSHTVYDITDRSYLVMRDDDGEIHAYVNACLHRGRRLKQYDGNCSEIRCPFHGFAWKLNGDLQDIPADWDFPHVEPDDWHLPEAQVGTWAGFVFINPDPDAQPLEEFLGELPAQFERWNLEDRYVEVHGAKRIRANWKIAQEAFCEAFHVNATHPQISAGLGDTNSQIDIWDTFARVITPGGTPSPLLDWQPSEEQVLRASIDAREDEPLPFEIPDGVTARAAMAEGARARWRPVVGDAVDEWSDAEMVDSIDYTVFPNFHPWGAFNRIVYRFRPNGDDHQTCIMEVLWLAPYSGEKPDPAPVHWLDFDDPWTNISAFGMLSKVFDQDMFNMEQIQKGLQATRKPGISLSLYQESKVRWLHELLGEWVEGDDGEEA